MAKVILDAGHGGNEPGAVYNGRREKEDNLRLALAVGQILEENGVDVAFTRVEDVYNTPFEKAQIANQEGGDFLISFHRNSSPQANQYSGVETLVFAQSGEKLALARRINEALEEVGFRNLGIRERPGLVILRRSRMPAVLVETGFINTDADNELFDEKFDEIAQAIADGILQTLGQMPVGMSAGMQNSTTDIQTGNIREWREKDMTMNQMEPEEEDNVYMEISDRLMSGGPPCRCLYRVQTGAFRNKAYAENLLYQLLSKNYPAYILWEDGFYKVQAGAFRNLDNAVQMEQALRKAGYATYITT